MCFEMRVCVYERRRDGEREILGKGAAAEMCRSQSIVCVIYIIHRREYDTLKLTRSKYKNHICLFSIYLLERLCHATFKTLALVL